MNEKGVVIVGAGLGGLRAAESLRANGFTGSITIVGDENFQPYNRPPLSKEALKSRVSPEDLYFRQRDSVADVRWLLGEPATQLSLANKTVSLANGQELEFDGLVIATGIRPRLLPIPGPTNGLFTLRTINDAQALKAAIKPGGNLVIIGSGFIGCEVAATATLLGAKVHVVSLDQEPMIRPLGLELGAAMRGRHELHGVVFHLGRTVKQFDGTDHITGVTLDNGEEIPTDVVVEAIGSLANTEWLEGNDLDLSDGVLVDANMQVLGTDVPVVAVGDIARHPNIRYADNHLRIEHWNMPTETGKRAGATLAALLNDQPITPDAFTALPSFWSDQYDYQIQSYGVPGLAKKSVLVHGDFDGACIVEYRDDSDQLIGVIGIDTVKDMMPYRKQLIGGS